MNHCPKCGGELEAAFRQHTHYDVIDIDERGQIERDTGYPEIYDEELIHLMCRKCQKYWYAVSDFLYDCTSCQKVVESSMPCVAIGPEELQDAPRVHAGDEVECPICGEWHPLEGGKTTNGQVSELLLYFKCGSGVFLAAIDNKLIKRANHGSFITKVKRKGYHEQQQQEED